MEGEEGKVIYPLFNMLNLPVSNIIKELEKKNVNLIFNDSFELLQRQKIVRNVMQETYNKEKIKENKESNEENQKIMEQRDKNFIDGPFGITKYKRKKYQLVGLTHITNIVNLLNKSDISYAVICPKELPSNDIIQSYLRAVDNLRKGTKTEKVEAIKTIKDVPIRYSYNQLHNTLNDLSGRVIKYASQALGKMGDSKSLDFLISKKNHQDKLTKWTIHKAISQFKDKKIEDLASDYLSSENRDDWVNATLLLHEADSFNNLSKIYNGLQSDDPFIRSLAINLIGRLNNNLDTNDITPYFNDEHPAVREEAIRLISKLDPELIHSVNWSNESDQYILNFVNRIQNKSHNLLRIKKDKNKIKGSIYGVIIGDAIGAPIEGMPIHLIKQKYGKVTSFVSQNSRKKPKPLGSYTDDSELTLKIMESISSEFSINPYGISKRFAKIGKDIDNDFNRNIGYGFMTLMAFRKLYTGVNWRFTGNNSSGCGAAMRVAPISAVSDNLKEDLILQSKITHTDPLAIGGALAVGYAIEKAYNLPKNFDRKNFIREVGEYVKPISLRLAKEIIYLNYSINQEPSEILNQFPITDPEPKRKGKGTLGTVPMALYSFLRSPSNFEETLITSINHSGDSDSVGAMAGAISGAYNGYDNIPKRFISGLYEKEKIKTSINNFLSFKNNKI